jgi:hypothetical protein
MLVHATLRYVKFCRVMFQPLEVMMSMIYSLQRVRLPDPGGLGPKLHCELKYANAWVPSKTGMYAGWTIGHIGWPTSRNIKQKRICSNPILSKQ